MKKSLLALLLITTLSQAESFDDYLKRFDYNERTEMKIKSKEALELY